jgi:hypothetical protein
MWRRLDSGVSSGPRGGSCPAHHGILAGSAGARAGRCLRVTRGASWCLGWKQMSPTPQADHATVPDSVTITSLVQTPAHWRTVKAQLARVFRPNGSARKLSPGAPAPVDADKCHLCRCHRQLRQDDSYGVDWKRPVFAGRMLRESRPERTQ